MVLGFLKTFILHGSTSRKKTDFENKIKKGIKLHTIRADKTDRWKVGNKIHFATGIRTAKYNQFHEGVCKGIQNIQIFDRTIIVEDRELPEWEIEDLAINDGFDTVEDFWGWFDGYDSFTGKLIHWTDIKY